MIKSIALCAAISAACAVVSPALAATDYPSHSVTMIVAYPPGGSTDTAARLVAENMSKKLGQTFVVENRPGAGGTIGASLVARSNPNGYTLLFGASAETSIAPATMENIPFNIETDFKPISLVGKVPFLLVANPGFPPNNVSELIKYAKEHPHEVNFSSFGNNTSNHLTGELFNSLAGVKMTHIPYKGSGPSITDLVGGQVQVSFDTVTAVLPLVQGGKLKALAVTTAERSAMAPNVPTLDESGIKGFIAGTWFGLLAPSGTSDEITGKLSKTIAEVLNDPSLSKQFADRGITPAATTPDEFKTFIRSEISKWKNLPKEPKGGQ